MKKFIFLLLFFGSFTKSSFSQLEKKAWLLGGSGSLNVNNMNNSGLFVSPNGQYFFSNRFCFGGSGSLFLSKTRKSYSLDAGARYFFGSKENQRFFVAANTSLIAPFNKEFSGSLGVGHVFFVTKNIGLETAIYGSKLLGKYYNIGLGFGLHIYLQKQPK